MAKYTMELREIISTFGEDEVKSWFKEYELSDYLTPEEISVINERNTWNKDELADRIVTHFYTREIGSDAIGQWMMFIKDKMKELMETYAPLIYSASIKYDPLVNVNFTESYSSNTTSESNSSSNSSAGSSSLNVQSDTPQGQISKSAILAGNYASNTNANEGDTYAADSANSTGKGSENYTKTTTGNSGVSATSQKMIEQYRNNIRAINTEIIYALEPLFMGLY